MARRVGRPEVVAKLVDNVTSHLVQGGYQKGEIYLSVRQMARRFRVSHLTSHKALQRLVELKVLKPRVGIGTFINRIPRLKKTVGGFAKRVVRIVHLDDESVVRRIKNGGLEDGIRRAVPACEVECYSVGATDQQPSSAIVDSLGREDVLGNILIRVSREMRQFFQENAKDTVVLGQTEPDIALASIGRDQRKVGELAMHAMLKRNHRRIALLMHNDWGFGDNELVAGLQSQLNSSAKRSSLSILSTAMAEEISKGVISGLLSQKDRPTAVICRSDAIAIATANVARRFGLKLGHDLALLSVGTDAPTLSRRRPAIAAMTNNDLANGDAAGVLLQRLVRCQATSDTHVSLPIAIVERASLG